MRIVVAGASGNLGGRIAKALTARGAEVIAVGRQSTNLEAACAGARCVVSAVQGLSDAIVDFQGRLAEAALSAGVKRFIPSDYSTDFLPLEKGLNRNFDLRRELHEKLAGKATALTSIYCGAFAEILGYGTPVLDRAKKVVGYFEDPEHTLDYTTMDDAAAFTAAAAMDSETPRALHCASFQVTPKELAEAASEAWGAPFSLVKLGTLADLKEKNAAMRASYPQGENETFPLWQRMQYTYCMFATHHGAIENDRYPDLKWTTVRDFLERLGPQA
jgi:nucleoside-diphosphate-sugar epimerase